ncbi:hypothetical protein NJ7G_1544 [Natrinema sp. J7-2]|nr:hypothetical protein NJ7G_1544 [Natrinema sp. J7-2]
MRPAPDGRSTIVRTGRVSCATAAASSYITVAIRVRQELVDRRRSDTARVRLADPVPDRRHRSRARGQRGVGTGIEERGEDHVAADIHAAVESEGSHVLLESEDTDGHLSPFAFGRRR